MAAKTRNKLSSHMSMYLGVGKELPLTQLPTLRDLLRYGLFLREVSNVDKRNYPIDTMTTDIMSALLTQWTKANAKLVYPILIHQNTIKNRLKTCWEKAFKLSTGQGKLKDREKLALKLDQLFDILYCHCPITLCSDVGCDAECKKEAHIQCKCKMEEKIPVMELRFVRSQREKIGNNSSHMIAGADKPESKKQVEAIEKKKKKKEEDERIAKQNEEKREREMREKEKKEREAQAFLNENDENNVLEDQNQNPVPALAKQVRNTKNISNIALASMRHHTGLRETAEIATAAWIDAGIITEDDTHLVIDHNKVRRAQEKLTKELNKEFEEKLKAEGTDCVLFDGRIDQTKTMMEIEGSTKQYPGMIKEEHYAVCSEPGGKYLWHFVPEEASGQRKHAEIIADHIVDWLKERNIDGYLVAIGGDSTNVNTGWEGGAMQWVEKKLGRRLVWLVCDLHTGELGLRHLIIGIDGPTLSHNRWSGPLGGMLDSATELEVNPNFTKIVVGPPLLELDDQVISDLSTDQFYAYLITKAIRSGVLPERLANLEIGPVSHARWLTTALRFCRIWVSKHGLKGKLLQNLRLIIEFIVGVYIPNWFNVKVKHRWVEGANHVLYQLQLLRSQKKKVLEIVMPTIRRSAWYAHPEAVLQAMVCSDKLEERKEAVEKILEIRGDGNEEIQLGDISVRPRRTPIINIKALKLNELVDLASKDVTEPPLTAKLTTAKVKKFIDQPMEVPDWSSHTQSVERCVKMVTEAAAHVYSHDRREGYIRSQVISRELMSKNNSKKDTSKLARFRSTGSH